MQGFDKGIKVKVFILGGLVLRKVVGSMKNSTWEKLGPNWEGPSVVRIGAYRLEDLDDVVDP